MSQLHRDMGGKVRIQLLTVKGLLEGTQRLERLLHVRDITFKPVPAIAEPCRKTLP